MHACELIFLVKVVGYIKFAKNLSSSPVVLVNSEFWKTWQLHLTLKNEKNFAIVLGIRKEGGYAPHVCTYTHSMKIPLLGIFIAKLGNNMKGYMIAKRRRGGVRFIEVGLCSPGLMNPDLWLMPIAEQN